MDCRRVFSLLALGLLGTCAGCVTEPMVPGGSAERLAGMDIRKLREPPRRKPSGDLCLAYGRLAENSADQPGLDEVQRAKLQEEARKAYQRALELDPRNKAAYLALGKLYATLGDHDRARTTFQKGLQKHPKDAALWFEQGIYLCRKKDWKAALESMQKANHLDPENREYATHYGLCLARAGRPDDSVTCLAKVLGRAEAHYNVARMMQHLNRPELSKEHLRLALQTKPDMQRAQVLLAQIEGGTGGHPGHGIVNVGFKQPAP
jgi:tetratricopeptide (TPR) repeat protein